MLALGLLFMAAGIAVLAFKALLALVVIPIKIGVGAIKLGLCALIGIPLLILGAILAVAAIPVVLVALPVVFFGVLIVCIIAAPLVIALKVLF